MTPQRRLRLAVAACAALVAASIATPLHDAERLTLSIPTNGSAQRLREPALPGRTYERDVLRVARVFDELALPLPERIRLELYPSADLLAHGITRHAGFAPDLASAVGRFAAGIAVEETLLLLEPEFRRGPRVWLRLLAHEMAHLSQIELGGGVRCGARWLVEGMADWVAFTVLDRLGVARMSVEHEAILSQARRDMTTGLRVDLDQMDGARGFLRYAENVGVVPVYGLAFVLTQHLIERRGLDAVVEYFRTCATDSNRRTRFERSFGQRLEDFERELVQALPSPAA
jgi:hypothetical protein